MSVELNEAINYVYDPISASLRTSDGGQSFQKILDYDGRGDDQPVYVGFGVRGLLTSATGWLINKMDYDGDDRVILVQSAVGIWDNRSSLVYE